MKRLLLIMLASMSIMATSCSKDDSEPSTNEETPTEKPTEEPKTPEDSKTATSYNEQYRPQIHFTPSRNWMNDPNGMVYEDRKSVV